MSDAIDEALTIAPGDPLDVLRRGREEARLRSQTNWAALFAPAAFGPLSAAERFAAAARVAEISDAAALARAYGERRDAAPAADSARLQAILRHAETIGRTPGAASRADLERLAAAGLSPAAIVTLSQIIGFVAYQLRVVAALARLGETA
jgi:uncharacterized protein YciW